MALMHIEFLVCKGHIHYLQVPGTHSLGGSVLELLKEHVTNK